MPELPEVETVRAGIERHVVGRTVATAEVLNPRAVRRDPDGPEGFAAAMSGRTFLRAERRGKYLWFDLDDDVDGSRVARPMAKPAIVSGAKPALLPGGRPPVPPRVAGAIAKPAIVSRPQPALLPGGRPPVPPDVRRGAPHEQALDDNVDGSMEAPAEALLAHLGMSGQLLVGDAGRELSSHVRARFTFTDGGPDLRFTDQRTFGHLMLVPLAYPDDLSRVVPAPIAHIAPDPLEEAFDPKGFEQRLTHKKTEIKRALLDQSLISGIGNIYADEALWRARLHWARPAQTLRPSEVSVLLDAVRAVLGEALVAGGTSFDALYVNVNGESGYFDRSLNAYGREGEPCPRCGSPIRRDAFMNRSSYSCPHCQKPSRARPPRLRLADAPKVG